jgi:hypothetical protein
VYVCKCVCVGGEKALNGSILVKRNISVTTQFIVSHCIFLPLIKCYLILDAIQILDAMSLFLMLISLYLLFSSVYSGLEDMIKGVLPTPYFVNKKCRYEREIK